MLPQKIGSLVRNPVHEAVLLSSAESYGFVIAIDSGNPILCGGAFTIGRFRTTPSRSDHGSHGPFPN